MCSCFVAEDVTVGETSAMPLSQSGDDALGLQLAAGAHLEGEDAAGATGRQHQQRSHASTQQHAHLSAPPSPIVNYVDWAEPNADLSDGSAAALTARVLSLVALLLRAGVPLPHPLLHRCAMLKLMLMLVN